jgi:glycosyltransferase involved in cell wall biosynthesis
MESLKFLMVSTHYPPAHMGGDAIFVEYLSNELVRAGHEVHVFHDPHVYALMRGHLPNLDRVTPGGVHRATYKSAFGQTDPVLSLMFGRGPRSVRQFREIVDRLKPEVIHWHNTKGFIGRPVAIHDALSLYTAHDYYAVCPRSNLLRPGMKTCEHPFLCQSCLLRWGKPPQLWRACGNRVLKLPEEVVVISPSEFLAKRLAREGLKVDYVLRSLAPDRGVISPRRGASRLVYLGTLEGTKGLMTLLEAFNISKDCQGFDLSIFGEGPQRTELESRMKTLGLEERVKLHGFVSLDKIKDTLSDAAASIVPAESYENAPLSAIEALSMGLPVIGTAIGGMPEILGSESGSVLIPPASPTRLADEIVNLWNNRGTLSERQAKARAVYDSFYSPEAHLKAYLGIVRSHLA